MILLLIENSLFIFISSGYGVLISIFMILKLFDLRKYSISFIVKSEKYISVSIPSKGHGNSNSPKQYSFTDNKIVGGSKFQYRLKHIDNDGKYEYSNVVEVKVIPTDFSLSQNYPNPFNISSVIKYSISKCWPRFLIGNHKIIIDFFSIGSFQEPRFIPKNIVVKINLLRNFILYPCVFQV